MLQDEKTDVSEGIDVNKTSSSKECMLCHYWILKDVGFKLEDHVCNGCHDLLMMAYGLANFRCTLWGTSRNEGLRRLSNSVLEDKGVL